MQIQIRKLKLKNNIFLAPMAGISDPVYCQIVKKYGCALAFSEMISIRAVNMGNVRTMEMLDYPQTTRPIAIQLFGNNPDEFVKAIQIIEKKIHPEMFDINMGCPVPKVAIKSKSGSALLKDPTKIAKIITAVRKCTKLPISIKIRSGWDKDHINAVEIARIAEKCKIDAITVHPRTREQGYSGQADWNIVKQVKAAVKIPVIGNGDVNSAADMKRMFDETKCDAIMIGRGAIGNPWIFLQNNKVISLTEKINVMIKHLQSLEKKYGKHGIKIFRTFTSYYLKGYRNSRALVNQINCCENSNAAIKAMKEFKTP